MNGGRFFNLVLETRVYKGLQTRKVHLQISNLTPMKVLDIVSLMESCKFNRDKCPQKSLNKLIRFL